MQILILLAKIASFEPRMRKYLTSVVIFYLFLFSKFAVAIQDRVWINSSACKNRDEDETHTRTQLLGKIRLRFWTNPSVHTV